MFRSVVLVVCCLIAFCAAERVHGNRLMISGSCGDHVNFTLNTVDGSITIFGEGAMYDYSSVENVPWYNYAKNISSVNVQYGVTTIGARTFSRVRMTSLSIANSVVSIGESAFEDCISLESVTLPNSIKEIKPFGFGGCISLASVDFPTSLKVIEEHSFYGTKALKSVNLPDSVKEIRSNAFISSGISSIFLPKSLERIESCAFCACYWLNSVIIPESIKTIEEGVFADSGLESITIPDSVVQIGNASFSSCRNLKSVTLGKNVRFIGDGAFNGCKSLESITIPKTVSSIGVGPFGLCTSLKTINVDADNGHYQSIDGVLFNKKGDYLIAYPTGLGLTSYEIPDGVLSLGEYAFSDVGALKSVTIPASVSIIGRWAFELSSCRSLLFLGNEEPQCMLGVFDGSSVRCVHVHPTYEKEDFCNMPVVKDA